MKSRTLTCIAAMALFAIASTAQTYTDLHDFNASAGDPYNFFVSKLAQGRDGNFYAESNAGGTGNGTVARMTPSGAVSVILKFNGTDGSNTVGGMTLGADGNLYGDTWNGGSSNQGVTFKVTPGGMETVLHNFTNTGDGVNPANALVLATDGNFYGTTNTAPDTIYKVSSSGVFKTLHTLSTAEGTAGGQLSQGSDGNFYGGMNGGGAHGFGTLFKMTPAGQFTVLHNFTGADGTIAAPGMVQAANGLFYGPTEGGGASNAGVVYKITSAGAYTLLHSLNGTTDGKQPSVVMLGTDGNIYGEAVQGGSAGCGTIFKLTLAGAFSVVHTFDNTHGCNPSQYLTEGTDGLIYGLTSSGGAHGNGVFYSLDVGLKPYILLQSTSGKVGSTVGILGQGFDALSVVSFNGVMATKITLTGTTYITATVPAGASTGFVTVTTGATTLTSTQKYVVHNSWSSGKAMPAAVWLPGGVGVLNGEIYVVGGYNASNAAVPGMQIYNPATNIWSTGASLPTATAQGVGAVVSNILYVFGGSDNRCQTVTNAVWAYNPKTNVWSSKSAMPTARCDMGVAVEKNIIYVVGGYSPSGGGTRLNTVEAYNPATDSWTTEASLLAGKSEPSVGLVGTTIVAADGFTSSGDTGDNEGYNASTNMWSSLKADPTARNGACTGPIGSQLYVAGGYSGGGPGTPAMTLTESFNPSTNTWTVQAFMPHATVFPGSALVNGLLYCIGGEASFQGAVLNNLQIYQP